jgi:hypothetical protein
METVHAKGSWDGRKVEIAEIINGRRKPNRLLSVVRPSAQADCDETPKKTDQQQPPGNGMVMFEK